MTIIKTALSRVQGAIEFCFVYAWLLSMAHWLDYMGQTE